MDTTLYACSSTPATYDTPVKYQVAIWGEVVLSGASGQGPKNTGQRTIYSSSNPTFQDPFKKETYPMELSKSP